MKVLDFINEHDNWEELLTSAPYNLTVKWDGDYFLLKYNMIESDFNEEIVRESRGSIFYMGDDKVECVCYPFKKFFNYGEQYADKIDWASAHVTQKIDGSLMKLWYHDGLWHLSTNNTIDAFKVYLGTECGYSFGWLFNLAIDMSYQDMTKELNPSLTYLFELTGPENRVVLSYPERSVWYLTSFNTKTGMEVYDLKVAELPYIKVPWIYDLTNLEDIIKAVEDFDGVEGVVVSDRYSRRIKVKSPAYLAMHHMVNNGAITKKRILELVYNKVSDDFLGYFPEFKGMYMEVMHDLQNKVNEMETSANFYNHFDTRKDVALAVQVNKRERSYMKYIFECYETGLVYSAMNFLLSKTSFKKLAEILGY